MKRANLEQRFSVAGSKGKAVVYRDYQAAMYVVKVRNATPHEYRTDGYHDAIDYAAKQAGRELK